MENNKVVSINKNKEPEIDALGSISNTIESFPIIERDILKLFFGFQFCSHHIPCPFQFLQASICIHCQEQ